MKKETKLTKLEMGGELYEAIMAIVISEECFTINIEIDPYCGEFTILLYGDNYPKHPKLSDTISEWFINNRGIGDYSACNIEMTFYHEDDELTTDIICEHTFGMELTSDSTYGAINSVMNVFGKINKIPEIYTDEGSSYKWGIQLSLKKENTCNTITSLSITENSSNNEVLLDKRTKLKFEHAIVSLNLFEQFIKPLDWGVNLLELDSYEEKVTITTRQEYTVIPAL